MVAMRSSAARSPRPEATSWAAIRLQLLMGRTVGTARSGAPPPDRGPGRVDRYLSESMMVGGELLMDRLMVQRHADIHERSLERRCDPLRRDGLLAAGLRP